VAWGWYDGVGIAGWAQSGVKAVTVTVSGLAGLWESLQVRWVGRQQQPFLLDFNKLCDFSI
jgi:hypothetical protein